jgi:hypothetical protein
MNYQVPDNLMFVKSNVVRNRLRYDKFMRERLYYQAKRSLEGLT